VKLTWIKKELFRAKCCGACKIIAELRITALLKTMKRAPLTFRAAACLIGA
jgi:hypothetical protein